MDNLDNRLCAVFHACSRPKRSQIRTQRPFSSLMAFFGFRDTDCRASGRIRSAKSTLRTCQFDFVSSGTKLLWRNHRVALERKENEDPQRLAANSTAREPGTKVERTQREPIQAFETIVPALGAKFLPGARSLRVSPAPRRGVRIGEGVWIGYDVILDTSRPHLITIEDRASLSMRVTVIAHFRETQGVRSSRMLSWARGELSFPT